MSKLVETPNLKTHLLMLAGLAIGLFLFTFNIIGLNFAYFPGDLGDGRLNLYFLEHAHKFFTGEISSFWDAPFMFPEPNVLSFSDNLLGSAPIYSSFRLFGFDIYKSYQLWFVIVSALNFITAFYFLKYVFKNNYAAILGAFIFAFSIALQSQLTHAQTFPRYAIPLAFFMAVKFSEYLKPKYFFFAIFFVVYQIYCGIYLGFMLAVPLGIFLVLIIFKDILARNKKILDLKWISKIFASFILNLLILLPLMLPYISKKTPPTLKHFNQISHTIPTIKSHFFSQQGSLFWDFLSNIARDYKAWWSHQIFAGGIATICLIIAFFFLISRLIKSKFSFKTLSIPLYLTLTALLTFFLFLRFDNISAYIALYFIPGFNALRGLGRIINIELIFFAIATAFVFSKLFKSNFKFKGLLFFLFFSLLIADNYFYPNKSYKTKVSVAKERTKKIENAFAKIPASSIVSYEPMNIDQPSNVQIDAMLSSQKYNLKTLNGYTATCPADFVIYWNNPNEETRNYWLLGKEIQNDTLYIVKSADIIEKISFNEFDYDEKSVRQKKLQVLINNIKSNKKWMEKITQKAQQRNITVDSMLMLDAIWMLEQEGIKK